MKITLTFLKAMYKFIRSGCPKVSFQIRQQRYRTCLSCSDLNKSRCSVCGCWVSLKTWCATESCPINKWEATIK